MAALAETVRPQEVPADNGKGGQPSGAEVLEPPPTSSALATRLPEWGVGEGWLAEYERIARRVAAASVLPEALKADARNVLAVALAGRELGLGFMEATRQIHIIKGQTALSAELKLALAKRDGLVIDKVDESNGCRIEAHRKDTGEKGVGEFTPEDKKQAGLGKSRSGEPTAWDTYPADMYWARAVTRLVRRLAPDAKGASFRSAEELSDEVAG